MPGGPVEVEGGPLGGELAHEPGPSGDIEEPGGADPLVGPLVGPLGVELPGGAEDPIVGPPGVDEVPPFLHLRGSL